jgi:hypothetical protein
MWLLPLLADPKSAPILKADWLADLLFVVVVVVVVGI